MERIIKEGIRVGCLYIARMGNKRGKDMLTREFAPKLIRPSIKLEG